eukprot:COSAG05_NODE_17015_length_333_cov_1.247863_1_plen_43_part_01
MAGPAAHGGSTASPGSDGALRVMGFTNNVAADHTGIPAHRCRA